MQDFQEVYDLYFRDVYKYCLSLCRDPGLAEEITQETFFKALKNIGSFRGQCRLYVWLCQIAKNTYFTYSQKRGRNAPEHNIMYTDTGNQVPLTAFYLGCPDQGDAVLVWSAEEEYPLATANMEENYLYHVFR